jgi:glycosyltransferase involved in cell wall biosynthesis
LPDGNILLKIVHIITRLILGGAQENTLITCRLLAQRGHQVTLITGPALGPEGGLFNQTKDAGYDVIVLDSLRRAILPGKDIIAYFQLKRLLRELQPDIVHTHSAKAGILGRWAGAAMKGRIAAGADKPFVVHTIHGLPFHPYQSAMLNKLYVAVEKSAGRCTDAFLTVADAMTEKAIAAGIGADKPYTTAYSAIDEELFVRKPSETDVKAFRRKYGISDQAVVLITVARLAELKGHEYIIESAKRLAGRYENCCWLFVGNGALTEQVKRQIQMAGLRYRVKLTGLLQPEQIPLAIHASNILVHCSLREGLARVLPQAMLCGKPVVSFDIDGAKEVVNTNTGFLIEPMNIDGLTEACGKLIENPDLRQSLGKAGFESVLEKFAPDTMVNTIEAVYRRLVENPSVCRKQKTT